MTDYKILRSLSLRKPYRSFDTVHILKDWRCSNCCIGWSNANGHIVVGPMAKDMGRITKALPNQEDDAQ